jgi:hypothetical protein
MIEICIAAVFDRLIPGNCENTIANTHLEKAVAIVANFAK